MSIEFLCAHCGYWYAEEMWDEEEIIVQNGVGITVEILRMRGCPACYSTYDATSVETRSDA